MGEGRKVIVSWRWITHLFDPKEIIFLLKEEIRKDEKKKLNLGQRTIHRQKTSYNLNFWIWVFRINNRTRTPKYQTIPLGVKFGMENNVKVEF